jgi:hypothetical protein
LGAQDEKDMMWDDKYEATLRDLVAESCPDIFKLSCFIGDGRTELKKGQVLPITTVVEYHVFYER